MKRIISACCLLIPALLLIGQSTLTVEITGLESNKGKVIVALMDKHENDVTDQYVSISNHQCRASFPNLKPDQYAIRFIHDENGNEELDTNFLGIPKEGFGFSNDAMGKFGPKDFSEWLFNVQRDTTIRMTAYYLF